MQKANLKHKNQTNQALTISKCPDCNVTNLRTFSQFNKKTDRWEWLKGCNDCDFVERDLEEEVKHPEHYFRCETSPAKINSKDIECKIDYSLVKSKEKRTTKTEVR